MKMPLLGLAGSAWLCHMPASPLFSQNPFACSLCMHTLNALKCDLLLFLMLKFFLPYWLVSTIYGWECLLPHVLLCNIYYSMGISKDPIEKDCVLKAWLRIEHRIPDSQLYINILRSHCYLQGFPFGQLLENPEQVRNLWSPHITCCSLADNGT